jgi:type VI secretion system secreted protein Hcp
MASIYMRIDGVTDFAGDATVKEINKQKGWFSVSNLSYGFSRSIYIDVGSSGDAESGVPAIGDISLSRELDSASALLETLFFAPGAKGKTLEFIVTKAATDGKGLIPVQVLTLEEARISSYSCAGSSNNITVSFTVLSITHYYATPSGEVKKSDTIKFDLKTGTLESGNKDVMK